MEPEKIEGEAGTVGSGVASETTTTPAAETPAAEGVATN